MEHLALEKFLDEFSGFPWLQSDRDVKDESTSIDTIREVIVEQDNLNASVFLGLPVDLVTHIWEQLVLGDLYEPLHLLVRILFRLLALFVDLCRKNRIVFTLRFIVVLHSNT